MIATSLTLDVALGAGRWAAWAGFALVVGLLVAVDPRHVGGPTGLVTRLRTLWLAALALSVLGALATILLQAASEAGGGWPDVLDASLLSTSFGAGGDGWMIVGRLTAVVVASALGMRAIARPETAVTSLSANATALTVVAGAVASALAGHVRESASPVVGVAVAALHLTAVGAWFGGIAVLVILGGGGRDIDPLVQRFSRIAALLVPAAVISGPVLAWLVVGDVSSIGDDAYSRWLIVKVLLVAAVLALAGATRLASRAARARATVRGMIAELVVASMILAVVSGLAILDPTARSPEVPVVRRLVNEGMIAVVEVADARVGETVVHFYFTPPGGSLETVRIADAALSRSDGTGGETSLDLVPSGPNHFTAVVDLPSPGPWTIDLVASPGTASEVAFSSSFLVEVG